MTLTDRKRLIEYQINVSKKYFCVIEEIAARLNEFPDISDKLFYLDYSLDLIKAAMVSEYAALSFYPYYCKATEKYRFCLNSGIQSFSQYRKTLSEIFTKDKTIMTTTVKEKSLVNLVRADSFEGIAPVIYNPQLELIVAFGDGYHKLAAISYLKKNILVPAYIVDFLLQFDHIITDGVYWRKNGSNEPELTSDYRFSVLYTLSALKNCLVHKESKTSSAAMTGFTINKSLMIEYEADAVKKLWAE